MAAPFPLGSDATSAPPRIHVLHDKSHRKDATTAKMFARSLPSPVNAASTRSADSRPGATGGAIALAQRPMYGRCVRLGNRANAAPAYASSKPRLAAGCRRARIDLD